MTTLVRSARNDRKALHKAGEEAARFAIQNACRAAYRDVAPESVAIEKDAMGKPYGRISGKLSPVAVSISHSFPFAMAIASTTDGITLGTDIERVRDFPASTWKAFLTSTEQGIIADVSARNRAYLRTLCWSLKESVLKAIGIGFRLHPRRVDVSQVLIEKGASHISIGIDDVMYKVRIWSSRIGSGYVATAVAFPVADTYYVNLNPKRENILHGNSRYSGRSYIGNAS